MFRAEDVLERISFEKIPGQYSIAYDKNSQVVRLFQKGKLRAEYYLDNENDFTFFVELEMIRVLGNKFDTIDSFINDDSPDFFGLTISSLKGLKQNPDKFRLSLEIFDSLIVDLVAKYVNAYDSKAATQIVFLGSGAQPHRQTISSLLKKFTVTSHSPEELEQQLEGTPYEIHYLPRPLEAHSISKRYWDLGDSPNNSSNNNTNITYYTADQVAIFHMCLWTPITLAIVLITFLCSMCSIDAGDTIVSRASHQKLN